MVRFVNRTSYIPGHVHHLRVEVTYPVHLQILISKLARITYNFGRHHDQSGLHAFALMLGHYTEYNAEHRFALLCPPVPKEAKLSGQGQFSVRIFDDQLVYIRNVYPKAYRFAFIVGKPEDRKSTR